MGAGAMGHSRLFLTKGETTIQRPSSKKGKKGREEKAKKLASRRSDASEMHSHFQVPTGAVFADSTTEKVLYTTSEVHLCLIGATLMWSCNRTTSFLFFAFSLVSSSCSLCTSTLPRSWRFGVCRQDIGLMDLVGHRQNASFSQC